MFIELPGIHPNSHKHIFKIEGMIKKAFEHFLFVNMIIGERNKYASSDIIVIRIKEEHYEEIRSQMQSGTQLITNINIKIP